MGSTRLFFVIVAGVLAALVIAFVGYQAMQPSDFDCSVQQADYEFGNIAEYEIDDACR